MTDEKRHFAISPTACLDVDNGVNFTFEDMGLWGNRPETMTQEQILKRFPFKDVSVCWTFNPNEKLQGLSPIEAVWAGRLHDVLNLSRQTFPTLYGV